MLVRPAQQLARRAHEHVGRTHDHRDDVAPRGQDTREDLAVTVHRGAHGDARLDEELALHVDDQVPQERGAGGDDAPVVQPAEQVGDPVGGLVDGVHRDGASDAHVGSGGAFDHGGRRREV